MRSSFSTVSFSLRRLGSLLVGLLLALGARAQPAFPPLPLVQHLVRVPLPPGGLVPYRRGERWGYADTTGRVVIAPVLTAAPLFSPTGFVRLDAYYPPLQQQGRSQAVAHEPTDEDETLDEVALPQVRLFANVRGEFLLVQPTEVALLQADSSLLLRPRYLAANAGQHELLDVSPEVGFVEKQRWELPVRGLVQQLTTVRLETVELERRRANGQLHALQQVGSPDRFAYRATRHWPSFIERTTHGRDGVFRTERKLHLHWATTPSALALLDERGQRLTPYRYTQLSDFSASGLATVQVAGAHQQTGGFGLLDRQGRLVLPAQYSQVWLGRTGGAVVYKKTSVPDQQGRTTRSGLVDERGQWLLPLQADLLSAPDAAGLVRRCRVIARGDSVATVVEYLTLRGQPAFPELPMLREASAFWQGKAWARTAAGYGLLDTHGRWVVPPGRYEQLQPMESRTNQVSIYYPSDPIFAPLLPQEVHLAGSTAADYQRVDTTYLLARRAGLYGIVRRATGQEVVPCRYELIEAWVGEYGGGIRQQQPYLLTAHGGRELAAGHYTGEWYALPGRGPLFQLYLSPNYWFVADTSGHPVTARLPRVSGLSFLTPENMLLLSGHTVADTAGHSLLPYQDKLAYSGGPSWLNTNYYWGSSDERPVTPSHAFIVQRPDGQHLLLAQAGRLHDATKYAYHGLRLLAGGWHVGWRSGRSVLLSPQGHEILAPESYVWDETLHQVGRLVPFANGTASVAESGFHKPVLYGKGGLITRGGRQLWED